MDQSPDVELTRRPVRRLVVEGGAIFERGLRELAPKRATYPKLAATLVRQLLDRNANRPVAAATVLMPLAGGDAEATLDLLPDVPRLTLGAALFPTVLDQLAGVSGRTLLAVLGDAEPPSADAHASLARALVTHDRTGERRLAERLLLDAAKASSLDRLVVEEKPGKAYALSLVQQSVRQTEKRWRASWSRDPRESPSPIETPPGWGVAGVILADDPSDKGNHGRVVSIASADVRPTGLGLGLDTGPMLQGVAERWLGSLGLAANSMRRVVVSAPWLAVSAFLGAALIPGDQSRHPDQILGWHPLLTLLGFLAEPDVPALLVYTGRHPTVHLVAVWS